ncbi:GntR family transcriptional regulator [Streptomyces triticagri]|uniref:GntR family transcriptional regulator n=1 Tax=Streptomyces triticagri TaxID=2293568 RepID=A0A372M7K6_9ACTN|nr:GntR family transcriptional regulator [Streptomyces triticagri]RFU86485.1 GntR family transcriptional regulator [Streptomyces triticagri]
MTAAAPPETGGDAPAADASGGGARGAGGRADGAPATDAVAEGTPAAGAGAEGTRIAGAAEEPPALPGGGSHVDRADAFIRARIHSGSYPQGSRLRERELAEALGVSRIPVREALTRLAADGLVVLSPRRGASVRRLTLRDVDELFDLRLSLEVFAARRAAEIVAGGGRHPRLREVLDEALDATRRGSPADIAAANTAFHAEIITMTGNRLLQATLQPSLGLLHWLFRLTATDGGPEVHCAEHGNICRAIHEGRPQLAEALAYAHIDIRRTPVMDRLAQVLPPE